MSQFAVYDAVVSTDEKKGDYLLPSQAFGAGALNVFVRRGVYNEESDVVLPPGATLTGEHRGLTIIDFGGNGASVRVESGFLAVETAGTVEVQSGSPNVVGTGTTFTNIAAGDTIILFDNDFIVQTITDDENLVLEGPYNGRSAAGVTFSALQMRAYDQLKNFTIRNSTSVGLNLSGCRRFLVENVTISKCTPNLNLDQCVQSVMRNVVGEFSLGVGMAINACHSMTYSMVTMLSAVSHGMAITAECANVLFHDVDTTCNGASGAYINGVFHDSNFTNCAMRQNYEHGVYANSSAYSFVLNSSNVDFNGITGMESHGQRTICTNSTFKNNVTYGIDMSGDYSIFGQNIGFNNDNGIRCSASRCNINDNSMINNANDCCMTTNGADNNIVSGNHFEGAGVTPFDDSGSNTTSTSNKP